MPGEQQKANGDRGIDWSRRTLLKTTGVGAGLAAVAGVGLAGQDDEGEGGARDDERDDSADDGHFIGDVVDPTFGYPLAADETDDVDLEHWVEASTEEGDGAHPDFPVHPEMDDFPFEFAFDPVGIHVEPGDLVQFESAAGEHTVTAIHEKFSNPHNAVPMRVPEESPGFTSPPIVGGESWVYQFEAEGVYDILCLPHFFFGMVMRVVVRDTETDGAGGSADDGPGGNETDDGEAGGEPVGNETDGGEGPAGNDTGDGGGQAGTAEASLPPNAMAVFNAEELDPDNIVEQGTVAWSDLTLEPPEPPEGPGGGNETGDGNESGA